MTPPVSLEVTINALQKAAKFQRRAKLFVMVGFLLLGFLITLILGQKFTSPVDILRYLGGEEIPGLAFTVGTLRFPRALLAFCAGAALGMGGVAFQTMLRNPLASPDIIGISSGASAAAVFAIVVLGIKGPMVSIFAILAGLAVALAVYGLAAKHAAGGTRLILVGIGVSAMLDSVIAYILSTAPSWTLQEAMRWLTGSVNGAQLEQSLILAVLVAVLGTVLVLKAQDLEGLRLGDDAATALGIDVGRTRLIVVVTAVGLVACATAVSGPIAFVAFLSGPIAARVFGSADSLLLPAALMGAILVLLGDYVGQFLLPSRYPVGVVTGALGAPYLIYLIISQNRKAGAL